MAEDINTVILVGRLTRDAELMYTSSGQPLTKMGLAVNRRKKQGDQWVDESHFFDVNCWGKRAEALNPYLKKGQQLAIQGQLRQDRWEQDGVKRSKVLIEADNLQLLGGGGGSSGAGRNERPAAEGNPYRNDRPQAAAPASGPAPMADYIPDDDRFEDDVPF
jgi:single-strand DNA-binding protein